MGYFGREMTWLSDEMAYLNHFLELIAQVSKFQVNSQNGSLPIVPNIYIH